MPRWFGELLRSLTEAQADELLMWLDRSADAHTCGELDPVEQMYSILCRNYETKR